MNQYKGYKPYEEDEEETVYNDGEDNKPKIVLLIIGIVVLLIILLIVLIACSNKKDTKVSTYLKTITIPDATIAPKFNKKTFEYEVTSEKDSIIIRCEAENKKATVSGCNKQLHISEVCKKHIVKVKAKGVETQEYTLNLCKKNEDVPIIKEIKITPETYTNSSVKVIVEAESSINLHTKPYSFDEGKTWQESNEYEVTENQVLNIRVRNEEGNGTSETLEITNIDKTQPKVTVDGSVNSGTTTTSNVELTSEVNPTTTVSDYKYQWYKDDKKINGATKSTYLATTSGSYKVIVTTGSGNKATSNIYKVVRKTSSGENNYTLSITSVSGNPSSWTKGDVTLKVNATTSNGLHDTAYSFDGGKTFQNSNIKQFTKNQEVNIVVRDKKNNKTTYKVKITKIDKTKPVINIVGDKYVNSTLTAAVTPGSTTSGYKYQWYKDNKIITGATSKTYTPTSTGTYKVIVTTGAGEKAEVSNFGVTNKPTPTVTLTSSVTAGKWTKNSVTLTATVTNDSVTKYEWYKDNKVYSSCTSAKCTLSATQNANYKVKIFTKSNSSITSSAINVKIDKTVPTAPTINLSSTKETSSDVKASITSGTDNHSGVKAVYYSYNNSKWYEYKGVTSTVLSTTGTKTIYAKTLDNAGNYSKTVNVVAKCDKDTVVVTETNKANVSNKCYIDFKFKLKNTGLTGITKDWYYIAYWKATKASATGVVPSNPCGSEPPANVKIHGTKNAVGRIVLKYSNQYYCLAIKPYRAPEIPGLNRWTVQWRRGEVSGNCDGSLYNGN